MLFSRFNTSTLHLLVKFVLLLAVASLFYRRGIIKPYTLQPFEIFTILSMCLFVVAAVKDGLNPNRRKLFTFWLTVGLLFMFFIAMGVLNGYFFYGISYEILKATIIDFFLLGTQLAAFVLIIYYADDKKFTSYLLKSFLIALFFSFFVFWPKLAEQLTMLEYKNYFWGWHQNFVLFASWCIPALLWLYYKIWNAEIFWQKAGWWLPTTLLLSTVIWSGSRSAWLGLALGFLYLTIKLSRLKYHTHQMKQYLKIFTLAGLTGLLAFLILPSHAQISALIRFFPQISNYTTRPAVLEKLNLKIALGTLTNNPSLSIPDQSRQSNWPNGVKLLSNHFWGLGPEYNLTSQAIIQSVPTPNGTMQIFTGAHNALLEIALAGGLGAASIFLYILWQVLKKIIDITTDPEYIIWSAIAVALFTVSFFHGALRGLPWLWITLAIILSTTVPSKTGLFFSKNKQTA